MTTVPNPVALRGTLLSFLQHFLTTHTHPSHLIICTTESSFIDYLLTSTTSSHSLPLLTDLLRPSLNNVHAQEQVRVSFCPTPEAVRACLSVVGAAEGDFPRDMRAEEEPAGELSERGGADRPEVPAEELSKGGRMEEPSERHPTLAVVNLIAVHRGTVGESAQGLGRVCASAVRAAGRMGGRLVLFEMEGGGKVEEGEREEEEVIGWERRVGLLSETMRRVGLERTWIGRTVGVKAVVGRWCRFMDLEGAEGL